ncbi:purine-cytosine permease family protein [Fodinicola acaciae]|uniref:purine-cytosine permease family protein n=1 Tax=Fodinicola acaciae TaxID=2681555 RepID=UPI0013D07789|nr:cytosine permease [Fodinicola acaciae]
MSTEVSSPALAVERNGINVIDESERKGRPAGLFWPWCAANISVLAISYGAFLLGFGVSLWQAVVAGVLGCVASFLLVGLVSLAGKRGSAPTMVLSRAAFGVRGNALPAAVSYVLLVGWEIVLVSLATLATATVFQRFGLGGQLPKIVAFVVVAAIIVGAGVLGFDAIMRLQTWLTIALAVFTVGYIALTAHQVDWPALAALPAGGFAATVGAFVLALTGFGLGWVNSGADYSRYLPRTASGTGVVGWTTFGSTVAPVVLLFWGTLLAGSDKKLSAAIGLDPIGALTTLLPTWYLVPFAIVAIGGLIGGAVLDIYSSGLTLLTLGVRLPRWMAAGIDGILMILGTGYVVWFAADFIGPFQGFLITLGVPMAAWCGIFLADMLIRRRAYDDTDLFSPAGRYGGFHWSAIGTMVVATAIGWGLVVNTSAPVFGWQGFLLDPLGLGPRTDGPWTYANLGVIAALVLGAAGQLLFARGRIRRQEAGLPPREAAAVRTR